MTPFFASAQVTDSLSILPDTVISNDTIVQVSSIEEKVTSDARDSIVRDDPNQMIYLYGAATITYGDIKLDANYIEFDAKNNIATAYGTPDSTGKVIGKPVFTDKGSIIYADSIKYNMTTKEGIIKTVKTEQGGGFLHTDVSKKQEDNTVHVKRGRFTTCELDHPHYYFQMSKAVVIPDDKIVSGPTHLVVEGIPTPLAVPFGFFPNKKGETAGILIPTYGENPRLGFYLQNGGYYLPINDHWDTQILGDIYSRGSWSLENITSYRYRYRFSGRLNVSYSRLRFGEKDFPDFSRSNEFFIRWNHQQDPKARPNSNFRGRINAGTSTNFRNNFNSSQNQFLTNTFASSITYDKSWAGKPYSFNINLTHDQNSQSRIVALTLPEAAFNVTRIYPGKLIRSKLAPAGTLTKKWYEQIGVSYNSNFKAELSVPDSVLTLNGFTGLFRDQSRHGFRHTVTATTSISPKKAPFTIVPTFNYIERWYLSTVDKRYDALNDSIITDTINRFDRNHEWNLNAGFNTKLYGYYGFAHTDKIKFRHVMTPGVTLSYRPDFGTSRSFLTDDVNPVSYSPYELGIYGVPSSNESGTINFSLINNIEAKVFTKKDTTGKGKKIRLLDNFSMTSSYDLLKAENQWNVVRLNGRTQLFKKLNFVYNGVYDPYDYDEEGQVITNSSWTKDGGLGRFTSGVFAISTNLRSKKPVSRGGSNDVTQEHVGTLPGQPTSEVSERERLLIEANRDAYVDFNIPWTLNMSYNLRLARNFIDGRDTLIATQTFNFSGDFNLTEKWKIGFSSGYDFVNEGVTNNTSINIYRNIHCWELSAVYIPFGIQQRYEITLNIKSALLQALKLDRRRSWVNNQQFQ